MKRSMEAATKIFDFKFCICADMSLSTLFGYVDRIRSSWIVNNKNLQLGYVQSCLIFHISYKMIILLSCESIES